MEKNSDETGGAASFGSSFSQQLQTLKSSLATQDQDITALEQQLKELQKQLNAAARALPSYDVRRNQEALNDLEKNLREKREASLPKKRFAFRKSRSSAPSSSPIALPPASLTLPSSGNEGNTEVSKEWQERGLSKLRATTIIKQGEELQSGGASGDYSLRDLEDCKVYLCGRLHALRLHNLSHCQIYAGPVLGSVLLENCHHCTFSLAAHQLRIHSSTECDFYLLARCSPILESCTKLRFAPYNFVYPRLTSDLEHFSVGRNQWDQPQDFNWPNTTINPNWAIIPEEERLATAVVPE
ncbi:hypothetical protein QOT17_014682 [Balamuthia mandrillaris]